MNEQMDLPDMQELENDMEDFEDILRDTDKYLRLDF